jgi:ribosome-interacting GTPase 1
VVLLTAAAAADTKAKQRRRDAHQHMPSTLRCAACAACTACGVSHTHNTQVGKDHVLQDEDIVQLVKKI